MKYILLLIIIIIIISLPFIANAQCNGSSQYPSTTINASNYKDITSVANGVYAGEYSLFSDFAPNKIYTVTTDSVHEDYITITTEANITDPGYQVVISGLPPLDFTPINSGIYYIHTNLALACGSESKPRNTQVICTDCPTPKNVGIGTNNPHVSAALDIQSANQGVLFPRHSNAGRDGIGDPTDGLTIYNTSTKRLETFNDAISQWEGVSKSGKQKTIIYSSTDFLPYNSMDEYSSHLINGIYGRGGTTIDPTNLVNGINLPIGSTINTMSFHYQDIDLFGGIYVQFMRDNIIDGSYDFLPVYGTLGGNDGGEQLRIASYTINHTVENDYHYYVNILYTNIYRTIHAVKITYTEPD